MCPVPARRIGKIASETIGPAVAADGSKIIDPPGPTIKLVPLAIAVLESRISVPELTTVPPV